MGPIVDRSKEFFVAADKAVVPLRERLLKCGRRPKADWEDLVHASKPVGTETKALTPGE
jgi:hypothetical protein